MEKMESSSNYMSHPDNARFVPDSRKLVHRHLGNVNDIITDDDIKNVKIWKELPPFMFVTTGAESISRFDEDENADSSRPSNSTV